MNQLFTSTNSNTSNSICSILATIVHALYICYCMQCAYNDHDKAFLPPSLIPSINLHVYTHKPSHRQRNLQFRAMAAQTHQVQHACALLATPYAVSLPACSFTLYTSRHTYSINEFACLHTRTVTTMTKPADAGGGSSDASGSACMRATSNCTSSIPVNIVHALYIRHDIQSSCVKTSPCHVHSFHQ